MTFMKNTHKNKDFSNFSTPISMFLFNNITLILRVQMCVDSQESKFSKIITLFIFEQLDSRLQMLGDNIFDSVTCSGTFSLLYFLKNILLLILEFKYNLFKENLLHLKYLQYTPNNVIPNKHICLYKRLFLTFTLISVRDNILDVVMTI